MRVSGLTVGVESLAVECAISFWGVEFAVYPLMFLYVSGKTCGCDLNSERREGYSLQRGGTIKTARVPLSDTFLTLGLLWGSHYSTRRAPLFKVVLLNPALLCSFTVRLVYTIAPN